MNHQLSCGCIVLEDTNNIIPSSDCIINEFDKLIFKGNNDDFKGIIMFEDSNNQYFTQQALPLSYFLTMLHVSMAHDIY